MNLRICFITILIILTLFLAFNRNNAIKYIFKPKHYLEAYKNVQPYIHKDISIILTDTYNSNQNNRKSVHVNKSISSLLDQTVRVRNIYISTEQILNKDIKSFIIKLTPINRHDYMKQIVSNQYTSKALFIFINKPYKIFHKNLIKKLIQLHELHPNKIIIYKQFIQIIPNHIINPDIIINGTQNITHHILSQNNNILHIY